MSKPKPNNVAFSHLEEAEYALRMRQHDRLFRLLAIAAGLIFLQGYMIAPLIPRLAEIFNVSAQEIGFIGTYSYVLWNGIYHSGVYTWLGLYLSQRYEMDTFSIGLNILGYGIPGLIFSPLIGKAVDRWGRRWLIPPGLGIAALAGLTMIPFIPPIAVTMAILVLSLGYDLTQPLFVGIITDLANEDTLGQTMGLKVFVLFTGFGIGSLLFGEVLRWGFEPALAVFGGLQLLCAIAAIPLFWNEKPADANPSVPS